MKTAINIIWILSILIYGGYLIIKRPNKNINKKVNIVIYSLFIFYAWKSLNFIYDIFKNEPNFDNVTSFCAAFCCCIVIRYMDLKKERTKNIINKN